MSDKWNNVGTKVYCGGELIAVAYMQADARTGDIRAQFIAAACNHYCKFLGEVKQVTDLKLKGQLELFK